MKTIHSFASPIETAKALAAYIKQKVEQSQSNYYLAISGGSTPKMLFEALVDIKEEIMWERIQLYWVDERCVLPTDDESNFKMTATSLLSKVPLPEQNIHRMKGELNPPDGLIDYEKQIASVPMSESFPQFDLIILGMGDDGHTASIFPPSMHLLTHPEALAIGTNPYSGQKRLTLTGKTIQTAKEIIFHITGKAKAPVLHQILNQKGDYLKYPSYFIAQNGQASWYVDEAALSK